MKSSLPTQKRVNLYAQIVANLKWPDFNLEHNSGLLRQSDYSGYADIICST